MKIIEVNDEIRIVIESMNYVVQRTYEKRNGEVGWKDDGYFPDLETLCLDLLNSMVGESNEVTDELTSLLNAVEDAKTQIIEAVQAATYGDN